MIAFTVAKFVHLAAIGIIVLVPAELRKKVHYSVWRQKALSDREIREIRGRKRFSAKRDFLRELRIVFEDNDIKFSSQW